jgi:hypothetical protein
MRSSLDAPGAVAMPLLVEAVDWTSFLEPDGGGDFPAVETPGEQSCPYTDKTQRSLS